MGQIIHAQYPLTPPDKITTDANICTSIKARQVFGGMIRQNWSTIIAVSKYVHGKKIGAQAKKPGMLFCRESSEERLCR